MNRQKIELIVILVVTGALLAGCGWFLYSALQAKAEASDVRDNAFAAVRQVYAAKVFPNKENIERLREKCKAYDQWVVDMTNLVRRGDFTVEEQTPAGFKQTLGQTIARLSGCPGGANGKLVKEKFAFGFDTYSGESLCMPLEENLPRLQQQLKIVTHISDLLVKANVSEITGVTRETFDLVKADAKPDARTRAKATKKSAAPAYVKQRFDFNIMTSAPALISAINALVADDMFIVIASMSMEESEDVLAMKPDNTTRSGRRTSRFAKSRTKEDEASDKPANRLVTDPESAKPLRVTLSLDVYTFNTL